MRYLDFQNQKNNIEKGKQIGCRIITEKIFLECGIQKSKEQIYLVYIASHDLEYDYMDSGKEEYYSFSSLDKAIEYIIFRNYPFYEFAPQKGNKIFNSNWFHEENTVKEPLKIMQNE